MLLSLIRPRFTSQSPDRVFGWSNSMPRGEEESIMMMVFDYRYYHQVSACYSVLTKDVCWLLGTLTRAGTSHFLLQYRCGHCKNLVPVWKDVGAALGGIINVAAVDADSYKDLAGRDLLLRKKIVRLMSFL